MGLKRTTIESPPRQAVSSNNSLYRLKITIPGLPKMLTNLKHNSWRAVHFEKKKWKTMVAENVDLTKRPVHPLTKASIICIRHSCRASDYDNRVSSFKAVIDGLVEIGVLADDSDDVIVTREYLWDKVSPKNSHITVIVEAV